MKSKLSREAEYAQRQLKESVKWIAEKGKYRCGLLYKYGREKTAEILNKADSRSMAKRRMWSLKRSFEKVPAKEKETKVQQASSNLLTKNFGTKEFTARLSNFAFILHVTRVLLLRGLAAPGLCRRVCLVGSADERRAEEVFVVNLKNACCMIALAYF